MTITEYIKNINKRYKTGISREFEFQGRELGKVQINDVQHFGSVPLKAWEFYIVGYQPAEKWLKDRRDRTISMEKIQHYQKFIVALIETRRIIGEVDRVNKIQDN